MRGGQVQPKTRRAGVHARLAIKKINAARPSSFSTSAMGLALSDPVSARNAMDASGASAPMNSPASATRPGVAGQSALRAA